MTRRSRAGRHARRSRAPDSLGRAQAFGPPRRDVGWDWTKPLPPLDPDVGVEILEHPDAAVAPAAYEPVRQVLSAAAAPTHPDEIAGDVVAAASFVAAREAALSADAPVLPPRRHRHLNLVATSTLLVVCFTGTAVAATTGSLPRPMQTIAHETLGSMGVPIPGPDGGDRSPTSIGIEAPTSGASGSAGGRIGVAAASSSVSAAGGHAESTPSGTVEGASAVASSTDTGESDRNNGNNGNGEDGGPPSTPPGHDPAPDTTPPQHGKSADAPGQQKPPNPKKSTGDDTTP